MSGSGWDFSSYVDPAEGPTTPPTDDSFEGATGRAVTSADSGDPFASSAGGVPGETSADPDSVGRPPTIWLAACAAAAVIGGVLAGVWGGALIWAVIGWCLSGPVSIGALAAFSAFDTRQRARPIYSGPTWTRAAYKVCLSLCGVAVIVSALRIAYWVGTR